MLAVRGGQRASEVADHLRRRTARILGAAPERVDAALPLTDLGMDSLMAVELMTVMRADFSIDVPVVKLLQGATLDQLAERVTAHLQTMDGAAVDTGIAAPAATGPAAAIATAAATPATAAAASPVAVAPAPAVAPASEAAPVPMPRVVAPTPALAAVPVTAPPPVVDGIDYAALDYSRWTTAQRIARAVVGGVVRLVADVHVDGAENLPEKGAVMIAANHLSMWDAPVLLSIAERRTVIFAAEELRKFPWLHWTLHKLWDAIYLKRGEGDTEAMAHALGVLRGGGVLGLSPEGIRSPEGLRRGLTGVAHLASRSGAPILPIVLFGQERIPRQCLRLRRTRVQVNIGKLIHVPAAEPTAQALRSDTERVMRELARMLPPEYRGVYGETVATEEAAERRKTA
jgi:1-acyl-sn-glycerol-3-phosphate acyltransferase